MSEASAVGRLVANLPRHGHGVNPGHGVLPDTSVQAAPALVDAANTEAGGA